MAGTMVHEGIVTIRLMAEAREEAQARTLLDKAEEEIRQLLGEAIFGKDEETLEEVVANLLKKHNKTIAIAESCTGGLVGDLLTNIPGISQHLLEDIITYTIKSKADLIGIPEELLRKTGVVNPETARAMAIAIRNKTGADIALSITGVAGPTSPHPREPVGLVYIALATKEGVEHQEFLFRGTRRWIKLLVAKNALDMVRLKLLQQQM
jgi:nicotinamide-nucleotide amidase